MITTDQQIQNIRILIKVAELFRREGGKLDMGMWASSIDEDVPETERIFNGTCGTTVCLGGLAGLDEHFRAQGLRTDFAACEVNGDRYVGELFSHSDDGPGLAELFGMNWLQYIEVFQGPNEVTASGRISTARTIARIVKALKRIAAENFGVTI